MEPLENVLKNKTARRRVWTEVDLAAVAHNVRAIKTATGRPLMACVKGEGYGHGRVPVARAAVAAGADRLSVAHVEEGVDLRRAGIAVPVHVLLEPHPKTAPLFARHDLVATVGSPETARAMAAELSRPIRVHVPVDTGMGRDPLHPENALDFLRFLDDFDVFEVEGIFSHFPCAYPATNSAFSALTQKQIQRFGRLVDQCRDAGFHLLAHLANSGGTALYPDAYFDLVRPGALIYGYGFDWLPWPLTPALSWKTRVSAVVPAAAGDRLGYDHTHRVAQNTRIALLSAGYADGYPRILSNKGRVLIRGVAAPVVGLVAMDQIMVDAGRIPGVARGDEAVLIGAQGGERVDAADLAALLDTSPVTLTAAIAHRVPRIYHDGQGILSESFA